MPETRAGKHTLMKIVYSDIPMRRDLYPSVYTTEDKRENAQGEEVIFPVNAYLKGRMKKGEKVRIVLLSKSDPKGNSAVNTGIFQKECGGINRGIGAEIEYVTLTTPFEETREVHESLLRAMIGQLEPDAALIADITYGPKPLPVLIFSVFGFAEKYFGATVENILYGRVDFRGDGQGEDRPRPEHPYLCDLTSLYYLNSLTNVMEYASPDEAVRALETLTAL